MVAASRWPGGRLGGILFHYNYPYPISTWRSRRLIATRLRRVLSAKFKRIAYELGAVPAARCNPDNIASQLTLQKAGFVPYAHILDGDLKS